MTTRIVTYAMGSASTQQLQHDTMKHSVEHNLNQQRSQQRKNPRRTIIRPIFLCQLVIIFLMGGSLFPRKTTVPVQQINPKTEASSRNTVAESSNEMSAAARTMKQKRMLYSFNQQSHFDHHRHRLHEEIRQELRFPAGLSNFGANVLNGTDFAYVHIFKNGGTTVVYQTGNPHVSLYATNVQQRRWVTVVRDPMDHFFSGWAEVAPGATKQRIQLPNGKLGHNLRMIAPDLNNLQNYDKRIRSYLSVLKRKILAGQCDNRHWCSEVHSFPQANFLLTPQKGRVARQVEIVGDLRELGETIQLTGFNFQSQVVGHRNSSADTVRSEFFPKRLDLLSTSTLHDVCAFVAIDYYLFDFEPPEDCREVVAQVINGTRIWLLDQQSPRQRLHRRDTPSRSRFSRQTSWFTGKKSNH